MFQHSRFEVIFADKSVKLQYYYFIGLLDKIYENKESIKNEAVLEKEENFASKLLEKTEVDFEPMDEPVEAFYVDENGTSEQSLFHHSFENNHLKV